VLSKCANPECFKVIRYLHQGEIFHSSPILDLQVTAADLNLPLYERFWLCTCLKHMTLISHGTHAKVLRLPFETTQTRPLPSLKSDEMKKRRPRGRSAGQNDE
jgi:hypothetical protein